LSVCKIKILSHQNPGKQHMGENADDAGPQPATYTLLGTRR
jgi:hypothetical protein